LRYDLQRGSFAEGWEHFIPSLAGFGADDSEHQAGCGSCTQRSKCRMCPAYSYLEHRRHTNKVDYLCRIAAEEELYRQEWQQSHRRFFAIGGFCLQVDADEPFTAETLDVRFEPFISTNGQGEPLKLRIYDSRASLSEKHLGKLIHDHAPWMVYENSNGWIYRCYLDDGSQRKIVQTALFNKSYTKAKIYNEDEYFKKVKSRTTLTYFSSDLIWLAQVLAHCQGFYLHSAGMIIDGQGILFVGHSTAGKSTSVKLFTGQGEILCDDRNILRKHADGWHVYGSWSHGELPMVSPASAPLRAIFFLQKSMNNRLIPMTDSIEGRNRLLACLIRPVKTPEWWEKTLPLINEAAGSIPCYLMQFDKSGKIVSIVRDLLAQQERAAAGRFVRSKEEV